MKSLPLFCTLLLAVAALAGEKSEPKDLRALLQQGLFEEQANRDLEKASAAYEAVAAQYDSERAMAATALFRLGEVRLAQGKAAEASALYQRVLTEFPQDQPLAKLCRERLTALGVAPAGDAAGPAAPTPGEAEELARVREIARSSPDRLNVQENGTSTLSRAAAEGWLQVAEFLVAHGVNAKGVPSEQPPLVRAAELGRKAMVEFLLAHGADVNGRVPADPATDAIGAYRPTPLIAASEKGNLEVARVLIEHGAEIDADALFAACRSRRAEVLALLLDHGADANAIFRFPGGPLTPLLAVCRLGQVELAKLLLEHQADPNLPHEKKGPTPLGVAVAAGSAPLAELLLAHGAKVNEPEASGVTPLHQAAAAPWRPELVEILLKHGASPTARADAHAQTPLHGSVIPPTDGRQRPTEPDDLARLVRVWELLLAAGAKIDAGDANGQTLLHLAMRWEQLPVGDLRWLIEHGASLELKDREGRRPVELASGERQLAIEQRYVFPKAIDPQAITIAVRLPFAPPRSDAIAPGHDAPATLADVLRHALLPRLLEGKASVPEARNIPSALTAVVLRAEAGGGALAQVQRVEINFKGQPSQGLDWPDLAAGDLVVLMSSARDRISSRELDAQLTDFGYPALKAAGAGPLIDIPFAIRAVLPLPQAGGETLTLMHRDANEAVPLDLKALLDDSALQSASLRRENGRPLVRIQLTAEGTRELAAITKLYVGQRLGIIAAGQLIAAPVVQEPITNGILELEGDFTATQARVWVAQMNESVAAGGFVTTPGVHHFFRGAVTISVSAQPGGFLGWEAVWSVWTPTRNAGSGAPGMKDGSGWFIYPESEARVWIHEGAGRPLLLVDFSESPAQIIEVPPGSPRFAKIPKAAAERYRQAIEKHAAPGSSAP